MSKLIVGFAARPVSWRESPRRARPRRAGFATAPHASSKKSASAASDRSGRPRQKARNADRYSATSRAAAFARSRARSTSSGFGSVIAETRTARDTWSTRLAHARTSGARQAA